MQETKQITSYMKGKYTVQEICDALEKYNGMVTLAAKSLDITPWAIYKRAKTHPEIKLVIDAARESTIDLAESQLRIAIMNGEPWAVSLALKTIGKRRGYVERIENTGIDGGAIKQQVILTLPHNSRDKDVELVDETKVEEIASGNDDADRARSEDITPTA